jgi:hypothetical protein
MSRNKYLLEFDLGPPERIHSTDWVINRLGIEAKMRVWCQERISPDEKFPNWQFSTRTIFTPSLTDPRTDQIEIAEGIFILDEATRTAFKLTFEL